MEEQENPSLLICKCNSSEHQIIIYHEEHENLFHCSIHLNSNLGFWKRLVLGIKYIFGYGCKYGHWDEFTFDRSHSKALRELSHQLLS